MSRFFNNRQYGIFAEGYTDRDGLPVSDTYGSQARIAVIGTIPLVKKERLLSFHQAVVNVTHNLLKEFSSAELDQIVPVLRGDNPEIPDAIARAKAVRILDEFYPQAMERLREIEGSGPESSSKRQSGVRP